MNLYRLTNGIGQYYVVANDPTDAQRHLEDTLNECDYGLSAKREVTNIELLTSEISQDSGDSFRISDSKKFLNAKK